MFWVLGRLDIMSLARRALVYIGLGYWVIDTDLMRFLNWLRTYVFHSLLIRNLSHSFFISTYDNAVRVTTKGHAPALQIAYSLGKAPSEGTRTGTTDCLFTRKGTE